MSYRFSTLALHAGLPREGDRAPSVHRTTAYLFRDTEHAANLFGLKELGYIYTRLHNPTQSALEDRMTALEGGIGAVALASGTTAIYYSIITICSQGDEIVASSNLYGGTYTMFDTILPQFGISVTFVDPGDLEAVRKAITPKTKLLFSETTGNPTLTVTDLTAWSEIAHSNGLPLIVDATFTPPSILRPFDFGADVVIHSLTKWIGGHGTAVGGIVIDSGKFNWDNGKFPLLSEPDPGYHDLRWTKDIGELTPLAYLLRLRLVPLRNLGACISPDNAWIFLQGIETLSLRMERHSENAMKVAEFLESHKAVAWVRYPGLKKDPSWPVASRQFGKHFGGMVVFGIKGGAEAGARFINSLTLFSHVANVGDAKSLAIHPASTTHSQLSGDQQTSAGLDSDLIRLSIGIEDISDILEDIQQALAKSAH